MPARLRNIAALDLDQVPSVWCGGQCGAEATVVLFRAEGTPAGSFCAKCGNEALDRLWELVPGERPKPGERGWFTFMRNKYRKGEGE